MAPFLERFSAGLILLATFVVISLLWGNYLLTSYQSRRQLSAQVQELAQLQVNQPEAAEALALEIKVEAIQNGNDLALGQVYFYQARLARDASRFANLFTLRALRLAEASYEVFVEAGEPAWAAQSYALLAGIQTYQIRNPDAALKAEAFQSHQQYLETLQTLIDGTKDKTLQQSLQAEFAKTKAVGLKLRYHPDRDTMRKASQYLEQAQKGYQQAQNPEELAITSRILANTFADIGYQFLREKDSTRALGFFQRGEEQIQSALAYFARESDSVGLSNALTKQAEVREYQYLASMDTSLLRESLHLYQQVFDHFPQAERAQVLYRWARLLHTTWFHQNGQDSLAKNQALQRAKQLYRQAVEAAIADLDLATLDNALASWQSALAPGDADHATIKDIRNTLLPQVARAASEQEASVQAEIRESDRATWQQRNQNHRRLMFLSVGSFLALLIPVGLVLFQQRDLYHLRRDLQKEIKFAQTRMKPHFIGNTLNAIDYLVLKGDSMRASDYLSQFSRLAKDIFEFVDKPSITLVQEEDLLKRYLSLEKLRMGEEFTYHIDMDPDLQKESVKLPPMLLQPIVENAIWHGLQPAVTEEKRPGHLDIRFFQEEEPDGENASLVCVVEDNGIGRKKARSMQKKKASSNRSTSSTKVIMHRLALIGHDRAQLVFKDLYGPDGQPAGTRVILKTPLESSPLNT